MNEGCVLMFVVVHLCLAAEKRERERSGKGIVQPSLEKIWLKGMEEAQ